MSQVVTRIERTPLAIVDGLAQAGVATVHGRRGAAACCITACAPSTPAAVLPALRSRCRFRRATTG